MKKLLMGVVLATTPLWAMAQNITPLGKWQSVDENGAKKAVVEITQDANGDLRGTIIKLNQKPGAICEQCKGDKKGKPIEGMAIIWSLKKAGDNEWNNGAIMDPSNGKTYKLKAEMIDGGKKLKLRGFIGVSLFGRTQTWERIEGME